MVTVCYLLIADLSTLFITIILIHIKSKLGGISTAGHRHTHKHFTARRCDIEHLYTEHTYGEHSHGEWTYAENKTGLKMQSSKDLHITVRTDPYGNGFKTHTCRTFTDYYICRLYKWILHWFIQITFKLLTAHKHHHHTNTSIIQALRNFLDSITFNQQYMYNALNYKCVCVYIYGIYIQWHAKVWEPLVESVKMWIILTK